LFREKWDRNARTGETYGAGTIDRAIRDTNNTYAPGTYRNGGNGTSNGMAVHGVAMNGNGVHHSNGQVVADDTHAGTSAATPLPSRSIDPLKYRAEDGGIMDAWLDHYGDEWMFVVGPDAWHFWSKTHWAVDRDLFVKCQVVDLMDDMNRQCSNIMKDAPAKIKGISAKYAAAGLEIPDTALKEIERIKTDAGIAKSMHMATKRSSARVSSVESMSRSKCGVSVDKLNIDDSLNLANGVLSLASLELRPHDRADLFTYCLDYEYDPAAKCPTWERAVSEWLVREGTADTDPELVLLFQELVGYSLTPDVKRGVMAWMFGEGSNGKSVAIHVIKSLLGPMAMPIDFQTVGQPGNYDLADIPGKRVLLSTESERGKTMSEKYIKMIVTGDPLKARPIYGSPIDFSSTAKIWWAMNDKPVIKDTTDSMWRRMKLIPFYRKFTEGDSADVDLPKKLEAELPGILNWAINGLIRLTVNGRFTTSTASEDAKQQYREEANPVAQWVNTMTVRTSHPATPLRAVLSDRRPSTMPV
jgi:P4 family phage/plasmid primase-like protien